MICETYAYTHKGGREHNEDYLSYREEDAKATWVLADGLGGHAYGELASKTAVNTVLQSVAGESQESAVVLKRAIELANEEILKIQEIKAETKRMRTTIVAALTDYKRLYWANVGDSRLYFFRKGQLVKHTPDHTVSYKAYLAGELTYEEIRNHEDKSKLLRVIGNDSRCKVELGEEGFMLEAGDAFLMCSDGFWEYIYELEMALDLQKSRSPKEWVDYMLQRHVIRAQQNHDNYSVVAVFVK